jgi:hypothetical protein
MVVVLDQCSRTKKMSLPCPMEEELTLGSEKMALPHPLMKTMAFPLPHPSMKAMALPCPMKEE